MNKEYWFCFIGPEERENICGDASLRQAVKNEYESQIGINYICSSGWGVNQQERDLFSTISSVKLVLGVDKQKILIGEIYKLINSKYYG
jgi:hypothetical protein